MRWEGFECLGNGFGKGKNDERERERGRTLERKRTWSGDHSYSMSSALEEFQLSELFLFEVG